MAINWSAGDAAKELLGSNKENIQDIGARFPLFANAVAKANDQSVVTILQAIPKITARAVESGLKETEEETDAIYREEIAKAPVKKAPATKAKPKVVEEPEEEDEEDDEYAGKSAKELFDMCKEAGLKPKPKCTADAYKKMLIEADEAEDEDDDWGEEEAEPVKAPAKKAPAKKAPAKKAAPVAEDEDDDDWDI